MQEKLNIERRMEDQIISFKTAVLAKEEGFDWEVHSSFYKMTFEDIWRNNTDENSKLKNWNIGEYISRPSQSLLQRWLREVHDISVLIDFETIDDSETAYTFKIVKYLPEGKGRKKDTWDFYKTTYSFNQGGGWYETYEEALELGLIEGLKLIK